MAPTIQPDPDMRLADSAAGDAMRSASTALEGAGDAVAQRVIEVQSGGAGQRIDTSVEELTQLRDALRAQAQLAAAAAMLADEMKAAAAAFRRDAPTVEEVRAAWDEWERLRVALMSASDEEAGALREAARAAEQRYSGLVERREQAIAAYEAAAGAAKARFDAQREKLGVPRNSVDADTRVGDIPGSQDVPGARPGEKSPRTPAPPTGVSPPAAASPATSTSSGGPTPAQAKAVSDLLSKQAGQPVALPQPQPQVAPAAAAPAAMAPAAAGPGGQRAAGGRKPFDSSDLDRALGPVAPLAALSATLPAVSSPAPAAPPTPAVTGTSHTGLTTSSDVSGRAEPARTAFSGTQTNLSAAAGAATESAPLHRGAAGQPVGHGGMPLVPPMMGGMGAGGSPKKDADPITSYDSEQALLHGHQTVSEAVPGGTIAQRRDD